MPVKKLMALVYDNVAQYRGIATRQIVCACTVRVLQLVRSSSLVNAYYFPGEYLAWLLCIQLIDMAFANAYTMGSSHGLRVVLTTE